MKAKISALMDGELDGREAAGALEALRSAGEVRDSWRTYLLISDAMHDARPFSLSAGFGERLAARLAGEPTVLAPKWGGQARSLLGERRWQLLSAAASIAAIGFVSVTYFTQEPAAPQQLAAGTTAPQVEIVQVAPPEAANDYLLAHQTYSPRVSLQGVAPYVRTVSSESRGPRQ